MSRGRIRVLIILADREVPRGRIRVLIILVELLFSGRTSTRVFGLNLSSCFRAGLELRVALEFLRGWISCVPLARSLCHGGIDVTRVSIGLADSRRLSYALELGVQRLDCPVLPVISFCRAKLELLFRAELEILLSCST